MSATAVPLRPVSKSGLATLWIGLLLLAALGAGFAFWQASANQIGFTTVKAGTGPSPTDTDVAIIKYEGRLDNGDVFDAQPVAPFPVDRVIPGFSQGLKRTQKGGKYKIVIPPKLGYGDQPQTDPRDPTRVQIPANSRLNFEIEVLEIMPFEQFVRMQQMMQQMQGGSGGPPPGAGAPPPR